MTSAWQHGLITNLDYLLFCNLAAGRSFNDLSQWPVFPWVLADYDSARLDLEDPQSFRDLSLPMGALNPSRLKLFQQRFNEMPRDQVYARPTVTVPFDCFFLGVNVTSGSQCLKYQAQELASERGAHAVKLQI